MEIKMLTKEQALKLYNSKFWEEMTYEQIAMFQLFEERLCMPFGIFHKAIEKTLKRPVWTHELASDDIKKEILGEKEAPTLERIMNLIPEDKRIIVLI